MKHARSEGLAFALYTGKILVVGGRDAQSALSSCELYDPVTNTWSDAAPLNIARLRFRGFVMPDGRVFVAGGLMSPGSAITPTTNTCEIYDPKTDRWKFTAQMSTAREGFLACQLPGSKVALMGGLNANTADYTRTFDIFDCTSETMTTMPTMPTCAATTSAIYNPATNSIVVAGGLGQGYGGYIWKTVQSFSLATNAWSLQDSLHVPQAQPYAGIYNPLNSSTVIYPSFDDYNGNGTTEIEVIDPDGHIRVPDHTTPRVVPMSLAIGDSALFLSGIVVGPQGSNERLLASCEWYDFKSEHISPAPTLLEPMKDQALVYYHNPEPSHPCSEVRSVYVFGGVTDKGYTNNCEALTWTAARSVDLPSLSLTVTPCSEVDTTITLLNPGCDTLFITTGIASPLLSWSELSANVAPDSSITLSVHGSGFSSAGSFTLPLHLTQYGRSWDTSIAVSVIYTDKNRTPIKAILQDRIGVHVGDTVAVPLYLNTSLTTGDDLSLIFSYNTNMLQMLAPSFDNCSMPGSAFYDLKERHDVARLEFPGTVTYSNSQPFIVLRFRVILTDTTSTSLTLRTINLGSNVTTGCVALETTSALITTDLRCGERPIYELLHDAEFNPLSIVQSNNEIRVTLPKGVCAESVRLFDEVGRLVPTANCSAGPAMNDIILRKPRSGFYTIVVTSALGTRTAKVAVVH